MGLKTIAVVVALAGLTASAAPALAMTGAGCPDLPEYYRAIGTIEMGPGACGMTTEEARRILAQHPNGEDSVAAPAPAPVPRAHRRHHRHRAVPRT